MPTMSKPFLIFTERGSARMLTIHVRKGTFVVHLSPSHSHLPMHVSFFLEEHDMTFFHEGPEKKNLWVREKIKEKRRDGQQRYPPDGAPRMG